MAGIETAVRPSLSLSVKMVEREWRRFQVGAWLSPGMCPGWSVERITVAPEMEAMQELRAALNPQRPARVVPAGEYTELFRIGTSGGRVLVMSDTRNEIYDHTSAMVTAHGRVVIMGLGLGMITAAVMAKPEVASVVVLEVSQPLIDMIVPQMKGLPGADKTAVYCVDGLTHEPSGPADYVWLDIWDDISMDNLEEMKRLKARWRAVAPVVECWNEMGCRLQKVRIESGTGWY